VTVTLSAVPPATVQLAEHAVIVTTLSTTLDCVALGAPGVPVAEKVAPGVPLDVAEIVFAPAVVPSVHDVSCTKPPASVDNPAGEAGTVLPPP